MRITMSFVFAVLITAALSLTATAQQESDNSPDPMVRPKPVQQMTTEQFNGLKTRVLQMIEQRKEKLDQEKACVEASTNNSELRKCRPEHPMGRGPGMRGQRGPGPMQTPAGQQQ